MDDRALKYMHNLSPEDVKALINDCFKTLREEMLRLSANVTYCPRVFDGFQCWKETPAGTTASQPCPGYIVGFDSNRMGQKTCWENGSWLWRPNDDKPWTNYTDCINYEDFGFQAIVNYIYMGGYALSSLALIASLIIFWTFWSSLNCTRTRIHVNLFSSVILSNLVWTMWYCLVINKVVVLFSNPVWCQVIHVATYYLMMTSYMWMFCESLHLHLALAYVFMTRKDCMPMYACIGWVFPILMMAIYSALRVFLDKTANHCWTDDSTAFQLISVPVLGSLFVSLMFLGNVVWVLFYKIRGSTKEGRMVSLAKAAKSVMTLVPLFGLHFILIPMHPSKQTSIEHPYQIFASIITSLQGVGLAVIFCFTNKEVLDAFQQRRNRQDQENDIPMEIISNLSNTDDYVASLTYVDTRLPSEECEAKCVSAVIILMSNPREPHATGRALSKDT